MYDEALLMPVNIFEFCICINKMATVTRYADKHARKTSPVYRANSEDKQVKSKQTYIDYLETQLEKNQHMNEQKISALEKMYLEHDEKFENIVKLIRLLQAFAETQDQENTNIKSLIHSQVSQIYETDVLSLKSLIQNNEANLNQCSRCIAELQGAFQDIERAQGDFEHRVDEFVQKMSSDLNSEFKQLQNYVSPRIDMTNIEQQLNRKIEVIMTELRQTAMKKDITQVEFRLKNLESAVSPNVRVKQYVSSEETDETTYRIRREIDEIRQVLSSCLNEQQGIKAQLKLVASDGNLNNLTTKEDLNDIEKKFNKKLGNAIDKLGNLIKKNKDEIPVKASNKKTIPFFIDDRRPPLSQQELRNDSVSVEKKDSNKSLDHLPQRLESTKSKKKRSSSRLKSEKSVSHSKKYLNIQTVREKDTSHSRGPSPLANSNTFNKFELLKKSKEEKLKDQIKKRRQLSPKQFFEPESVAKLEKTKKLKKPKKKQLP